MDSRGTLTFNAKGLESQGDLQCYVTFYYSCLYALYTTLSHRAEENYGNNPFCMYVIAGNI